MDLSYHKDAFELIGVQPRRSRTADRKLRNVELKLGAPLPGALRELYSIDGIDDIANEHWGEDRFLRLDEVVQWDYAGQQRLVVATPGREERILVVTDENQSCACWGALLDGSDDPVVFLNVTEGYKDDPSRGHWWPHALSFSTFVYTRFWDSPLILRGHSGTFDGEEADQLSNCTYLSEAGYVERASTWLGGGVARRFERGTFRLLLHAGQRGGEWFSWAITEEERNARLRDLRGSDLPLSFSREPSVDSTD